MASKPNAAAPAETENPADDRRRDLDQFAEATARPIMGAPTVMALPTASDRVFGAQQVAVYRDDSKVLAKIKALAAAAGTDWYYRFPVKNKKKGTTDWIEGPSIKLANDVARIYGNCDIDVRVVDIGEAWLFYARLTDFETGYALTRPFQQRKSQGSLGGGDDARALDIAFQIGASKAIRNVTVNALQTFADFGFEEARNSLVEKIGKNLARWRERTVEGLNKIPVPVANAERVVGRAVNDWLATDVAMVIAMMKAIADGMATADEIFPSPNKQIDGDGKETETDGKQSDAKDKPIDQFVNKTQPESSGGSQSSKAPEGQGPAAPGSSDAPPQSETKQTGAAGAKPADQTKTEAPKAPAIPANERGYIAHANTWREAATDADAATRQWAAEKNLRNKCNVGGEHRDDLKEKLDAKIAALRTGP